MTGEDLAAIAAAIPFGMINSVNLIQGCDQYQVANGRPYTRNTVPSLEGNLFEGVETIGETKSKEDMSIRSINSAGHCLQYAGQ